MGRRRGGYATHAAKVVLGVDLDTAKVSYALVETTRPEDAISSGVLTARGSSYRVRLPLLVRQFYDLLVAEDPNVVVIEDLAFVRNRKSFSALAQTLGALYAAAVLVQGLPESALELVVVAPGHEWKRGIGLSGNANKSAIAEFHGLNMLGLPSDALQDQIDAHCIALYGAVTYG